MEVTPESAGWRHLGFEVLRLGVGESVSRTDDARESCVIVLSGSGEMHSGDEVAGFQGRADPFSGLPHGLYAPPGTPFGLVATTEVELAIGSAPAEGNFPARLFGPDDVTVEMRGGHNALRQITHVIDPGQAERLLCVEVYTPSGNWSSYPPHRHDEHDEGVEVDLDEVYHYRIAPEGGFALQRLYDDARDLDDVVVVSSGDTVLVRRGYHPVVMPPGYDGYYLNFLAGDVPSWVARDEPDLAWVRDNWQGRPDGLRLPMGRPERGG